MLGQRKEIRVPGMAEPISHFTHVVTADPLIFVSGCVAIDGAGRFVAPKPGSPLNMNPVALPRFSPEMVISTVVPR